MFKKKECYLCGGKLIDGRCSSCGLDNTKLEKKNYRLNESSFDRKKKMTYSQKRQNETGETKKRVKASPPPISCILVYFIRTAAPLQVLFHMIILSGGVKAL